MIAQQDSIYVAEDTLITSKLLNDASDTRTLSKSSSGRIHSFKFKCKPHGWLFGISDTW